MYPQHTTRTEYKIVTNALKPRASCSLSHPDPSGALSLEPWGLTKFFMLVSHLQATAVECFLQEEVLPPDPGTISSTAKGAGFARFTTPANYYLIADPRLAQAPETSTSVLGLFKCQVNYILTPMYPQHMTLTENKIVTNTLKARIAVNVRAIGIIANTLQARASCSLSQPNPPGALLFPSLGTNTSSRKCFQT